MPNRRLDAQCVWHCAGREKTGAMTGNSSVTGGLPKKPAYINSGQLNSATVY